MTEGAVLHSRLLVGVGARCTAGGRFARFVLFAGTPKGPAALAYLGNVLPGAIMGMLVVYCFRSVPLVPPTFGLPEWICGAAVLGLHLWRRNTLLSVAGGTVLYMFLVQVVFA